jgi:DNA-directed RNA polymerase specialized sigma24 family protein
MRGHCREALHRMIAATRHCRSFLDEEDFAAPAEEPASRIDLRGAIASLDEPQRSILGRQAAGDSLHEIARDQRLTYWQVWRLSRRGIEQLRAKLSP